MSSGKRQTLPSQKGTDLWPQITQPPAKLVIKGVQSNTPLYHAVANTFAGPLKAFHAKAQQAYSLSTSQVHKTRYNWGPARATYSNVQGQEIIELEVVVPVLEEIHKEIVEQNEVPWDWALIDIHVPVFTYRYSAGYNDYTESRFAVRITTPKPASGESVSGSNVPNLSAFSFELKPLSQWAWDAPTYPFLGETGSPEIMVEKHSLIIDMRNFHSLETMTFDLFGGLEEMTDDPVEVRGPQVAYFVIERDDINVVIQTATVPAGDPNPFDPSNTIYNYRDESAVPIDYPQHGGGFNSQPPYPYTPSWGEIINLNFILVLVPQGTTNVVDNGDGTWTYTAGDSVAYYEYYRTYEPAYVSTPVVPTALAHVEAVLFRGTPPWGWSSTSVVSFVSSYMWEITTTYPRRPGTGRISRPINMPVTLFGSDSLGSAGNWGLGRLGNLTVSPKHGWAAFG